MSKDILPDYRRKQQLLYEEQRKPAELITYGEKYLAAGRIADAIEFYQVAKNIDGLEKIRVDAREKGDVMLFQQASKALNLSPAVQDWLTVGQAARARQKYSFALLAFEKGGDETLLQETRTIIQRETSKTGE